MYKRTYKFPGLAVCVESEEPISGNANFDRFITDESQASEHITVRRAPLPQVGEAGGGKARRAEQGGVKYRYTAFFDPSENRYRDYACLVGGETNELYIDCEGGLWDSMIVDALDIPDKLLAVNAAFIHSSFVIVGGEGILFAGNKQVGKSTQAALWCKYRSAEIVNGDRAVIRLEGSGLRAYGSAFCGSSGIALDRSAPVRAIVLPGKAPTNTVLPVGAAEAFRELLGKMTYDTDERRSVEAAAAIAAEAAGRVPVVRLLCTPDERSVEALEAALWRKE